MNTNDLINECIRVYNNKVEVCIHTWKSLPPDIVSKIKFNMSACVQTLRNNISDCKYDEDYDGTKNVLQKSTSLWTLRHIINTKRM